MSEPKVSIVMPVYNAGNYLKEAIQDILDQTYTDFELICVDDGSIDGSADVLKDFAEHDSRIRIITQENKGAGTARNTGMDAARGSYIWFPDSDDRFDGNFVERMLGAIENSQSDVAVCGGNALDEISGKCNKAGAFLDVNLLPEKRIFSGASVADRLFQLTAGWPWDKMYRLSFLREHNIRFQELRTSNDGCAVFMAYALAERIVALEDELVTHRINLKTSIEQTRASRWRCGYEMIYGIKEGLIQNGLFELYEQTFINFAAEYIQWNMTTLNESEYYVEFYNYTFDEGLSRLDFQKYDRAVFRFPHVYDSIKKALGSSPIDFLLEYRNQLRREIQDRDETISNSYREIDRLNNEVHERDNTILNSLKEIDSLKSEIQNRDESISNSLKSIEDMQNVIKDKENTVSLLLKEKEENTEEMEWLKGRVEALESSYSYRLGNLSMRIPYKVISWSESRRMDIDEYIWNKYRDRMFRWPRRLVHRIQYNALHNGHRINFKNPKLYDEKIHWLIVNYYNTEEFSKYADKIEVREYVRKNGFEDLLIPLAGKGIYEKPEDIVYDDLPPKFVLKTNHGSGDAYYYICRDKNIINQAEVNDKLNRALNMDMSHLTCEYHYKYIQRRIICEALLEDGENYNISDYKVVCSYGKACAILVCSERDEGRDYFSLDWEYLPYVKEQYRSKHTIEKPLVLEEMINAACILSKPFPLARVDFYAIDKKLYFGEITLTPAGGNHENLNKEGQIRLGEGIDLPKKCS